MKAKAPKRRTRRTPWIVGIVAAVVVAGAAAYVVWPAATMPPIAGGVPRLVVDRTEIDFGDVPYNRMVDATFKLTNSGDGVLRIAGTPRVTAVQGC